MELRTHLRILIVCSLTFIHTNCDPVPSDPQSRTQIVGGNVFDSFDDVAYFLRSWFARIRSGVGNILDEDHQTKRTQLRRSVVKREIPVPKSFEEIEKEYLLTQSKTYLEQLFGYVTYIKNDTETRTELDQIMQDQIARLQKMSLAELKLYCAKLQTAMKNGISLNHEITVNGRRYSLESIAQVCCPWG